MRREWWIISAAALIILIILVILAIRAKNGNVNLQLRAVRADSVLNLSRQANDFEAKGNLLEARLAYQKLINDYPGSPDVVSWQKKVEGLNIRLLFSPILTPNSILYEIKPGDTLSKVANGFKTTPELIMKSNNLTGNKVFPGKKLKVWTVPFSILADKSQNMLILKANEDIVKTYIVSTGANNSTPIGSFKIVNKLQNPTWFKAGAVVPASSPENILGSRWLGFDIPGYGIHGTTEPKSLGKQVTQGCIRMSNTDVEELYAIIPTDTRVTIVD